MWSKQAIKQACSRETAAEKALENDKQELVDWLEVTTEESKKEAAQEVLLMVNIERLTEESSRETAAEKALENDKQVLVGLRNELTIAVFVLTAFNFVLHVVIKIYKKTLVEHSELHLDLQGDAVTYLEYSERSTCSNSVFL